LKPIYILLILLISFVAACSPAPVLRDSTLLQDESLLTPAGREIPPAGTPTPMMEPAATEAVDAEPTPTLDPVAAASIIQDGGDEGCSAPCWRGITPGTTAWRDALTIIEDDATLENLQIQGDDTTSAVGVQFQNVGGSRACCNMASRDGETVDFVSLQLAPTVSVSEVIEVWGDPTYAIGGPVSDDQALVYLFYPNVPMMLAVFVAGAESSITASSEVIGVIYTTTSDMDELVRSTPLHFWDGYDTFAAYDDEEGTFDQTAMPTLPPTTEPTAEGG
jgi:hypothetical protein